MLLRFAAILLLLLVRNASAQVLVAADDAYEVPFGGTLVVDAPGVLANDTLDGEPADENGASVELLTDASWGTLLLAADGSFSYAPGPGFDGSDSFVYRAVAAGATPAEATVVLTACAGGPQVFSCWNETAFLMKAAALGLPSFKEGFEGDPAWAAARSPSTAASVDSRGIVWRANDFDPTHVAPPYPPSPPPNEITTGPGPARSGGWGVFDPDHGYATGTSVECDVDMPAAHCLFHDGFTVRREGGPSPLYGLGGWFTGTYGANVAFVLDGDIGNPVGGGKLTGGFQFFGVIDAGPTGLTEIQVRELDGKVGQALLVFGDDFTVLAHPVTPIPALRRRGLVTLAVLLAAALLAARRARRPA